LDNFISKISIRVNESIYLKNPETSDLGNRIISGSIDMINDLGFDQFTFRKLAQAIKSTEASIYRYFENKHKLLLYLTSWYWNWTEYKFLFSITNIISPKDRLRKAINILTEEIKEDSNYSHINEIKLNQIVIAESSKVYLTKDVDAENKEGVFAVQKQLVERVSNIILEINPDYKYPHMLVSTIIEGSHMQRFFVEHLPKLTDIREGEDAITSFYVDMVFKAIKK